MCQPRSQRLALVPRKPGLRCLRGPLGSEYFGALGGRARGAASGNDQPLAKEIRRMEYVISIFLFGVIITFIVIVGMARAAEFSKQESAGHLEIDHVPKDWDAVPEPRREG